MHIHSIPGKLDVQWRQDIRSIVDTWTTYFVSLEEFSKAVLDKGLAHAKAHGGIAYIVDSSTAKGAFKADIQEYIASHVFPSFSKGGIKYFITITSEVSAVTKMTVASYSAKAGPNGLKLVELGSVEDAATWLKTNAPELS